MKEKIKKQKNERNKETKKQKNERKKERKKETTENKETEGERRKKQDKYKVMILHQNDVKERKNWKRHIVISEWLCSTFSLVKIYNKSEKQKYILKTERKK